MNADDGDSARVAHIRQLGTTESDARKHGEEFGPALPTATALWTATERLRALEDAAPSGIVALDLDGRVTIWNRAAEDLFGWEEFEVLGKPYPLVPDDRRIEDAAVLERVLAGEVVSGLETSRRRRDGSQVAVSLSCGPIRDAERRICGTIRILTDITEAQRLRAELLQAQKMEAFGHLAGGVAHDFNNLLTVINGFSELLLERAQHQPELAADVEEIKKAAARAAALTRQLLAFGRKQACVLQVLDLNQLLRKLDRMLRRIVRENIRLEFVLTASLAHTKADPGQVEQVVMNLVVNAADAMPHGGTLCITTENVILSEEAALGHGSLEAGRYVSLTVLDTGCGMSPDVLLHAFEPFFTTKGPGKGTGLGLSTVLSLVEQSGGHLEIDSVPGVGTVVTTYWTVIDSPVASPFATAAPRSITGSETILLVEDEDSVRALIETVLKRQGYTILSAGNAEEALAIEEQYAGAIDLLLSDVVMPGLGGPDLAQHMVRRRPAIQVLFISGYGGDVVDRGASNPKVSFLQKPFEADTLLRTVRIRLDDYPAVNG